MAEVDTAQKQLLRQELTARFGTLRALTEVPEGPQEAVLGELMRADPLRVGWLVAPSGRGLGFALFGRGSGFAEAVGGQVRQQLGDKAATMFHQLALGRADAGVDFEMILGEPGWLRAGIRLDDYEELRSLLEALDVPADHRDWVLRHGEVRGASPYWMQVMQAPPEPRRLLVASRLPGRWSYKPAPEHVGDRAVLVEETLGDTSRQWLRRPGLADRQLVEWLHARGFDRDEPRRVGEVHGVLDVHGPDTMAWEHGRLADTLVHVYEQPFA